jgi:hypothetical protein
MERWSMIPVSDWQETRDTLHPYTQVVGKIWLANEPPANHWWNARTASTSQPSRTTSGHFHSSPAPSPNSTRR